MTNIFDLSNRGEGYATKTFEFFDWTSSITYAQR